MPGAVLSWIFRLGVDFWTKGAVAGRAANACLLDSQGGCCASSSPEEARWLFLWISLPLSASPSVFLLVSLSLSLPTKRRRRQTPLAPPSSHTSASQASVVYSSSRGSQVPVQLLDYRAFVPPSISAGISPRGRREEGCGHKGPGKAEYRSAARKMSPYTHLGGGGSGRVRGRWARGGAQ